MIKLPANTHLTLLTFSPMNEFFLYYFMLINIVTFVVYGLDKYKARHQQWRIPEKTLLLLAGVGGAIGAYSGMLTFRHKTKHRQFNILVPLFALIWIVVAYYVLGGSTLQ